MNKKSDVYSGVKFSGLWDVLSVVGFYNIL